MFKRQKEVALYQLSEEEKVIKQLESQYRKALEDVEMVIRILMTDDMTPSRINRIGYQQKLKAQLEGVLEALHNNEYKTINAFLQDSYTDAFVGTMYDLHGQDVPMILPIDQNVAVKAIQLDAKLSERKIHPNLNGEHVTLYESLGVDVDDLKKTIRQEITRGLATGMAVKDIARNISFATKAPLNRAKTIAQTESHRIQETSKQDARHAAKANGADLVKYWDSIMDGDTRSAHRQLDGQTREVDEPFEVNGHRAMQPGGFGIPGMDIRCRCMALTRARKKLSDADLKRMQQKAEFWEMDKAQSFEDFKKKYLKAATEEAKAEEKRKVETVADINARATDALLKAYDDRRMHFGLNLTPADALRESPINPVTANYTGLSPETARVFNEVIEKLSEDYYSGITRIEVADRKKMLGVSSFASTHRNNMIDQAVLEINPVKTKDYDKMVERIKELAKKGYAVKVLEGKEGEYIATHEFAHSLFDIGGGSLKNYVGLDTKPITRDRKAITAIYDKYKQDVQEHEKIFKGLELKAMMADDAEEANAYMKEAKKAKEKLDRIKISNYSLTNADEFMAEAFTQAKIGASVSPYANDVMAVLDKTYKKPAKAAETLKKQGKSGIIKTDKQFGKKIGKHAVDFGLDPGKPEDREKMRVIIDDISGTPDEIAHGNWAGQTEPVKFFIKNGDVVVATESGTFVTILKGGITNARVKNARRE